MHDENRPARPLPYDELSGAIGDDEEARARLDALNAYLQGPAPDRARIEHHIDSLRGVRDVGARIANWFDDPETQRWIMTITDAGL